jgi:hypothetical protein
MLERRLREAKQKTAQLSRIIQQQAAFLGFLDCFWVLGCACLIGAPLVFSARKIRSAGTGAAH